MNQWIADRSYGTGIALAFSGEPEFVRRSINFAVNYLLTETQKIREQTQTFAVVLTTEENLRLALYREAYNLKMLEVRKAMPRKEIDWDALPEDFNPETISFSDEPSQEQIDAVALFARESVEATIASLVGEAFTNKIPTFDAACSYAMGNIEGSEVSA